MLFKSGIHVLSMVLRVYDFSFFKDDFPDVASILFVSKRANNNRLCENSYNFLIHILIYKAHKISFYMFSCSYTSLVMMPIET